MATTSNVSAPPSNSRTVAEPRFGKGLQAATKPLQQACEMFALLMDVTRSAITKPTGSWGDVRAQMFETLKRCRIPAVGSLSALI